MRFLNYNNPPKSDNPLDFGQGKAGYSSLLIKLGLTAFNNSWVPLAESRALKLRFSMGLRKGCRVPPTGNGFGRNLYHLWKENMSIYTRAKFEVNQFCANHLMSEN